MSATDAPRAAAARRAGAWFLFLAFFVSAFNIADRLVIGIAAEPIKHAFGLSDAALGLLSGTAFALVYPPLGLPIAWLADRANRRNILAAALAFWSLMTAICGLTQGFPGLLLARMGVAVGEAGYAPTTHALIADSFPANQRARAFSVLTAGVAAGGFAASAVGGWAAAHFGWRAAFLIVGAPGLLLALLVRVTVTEPVRTQRPAHQGGAPQGLRRLLGRPAYLFCICGSALHLMVTYAAVTWTAPFVVRTFHLGLTQTGLILGVSSLIGGVGGGVAGGWIGDRLARTDRRWLAWWPAITVTAAIPFGVAAYQSAFLPLAVGCVFAATFLNALYQSSTYALVQDQAEQHERATAAALMIFVQNAVGLGLGPLLVGALSDHLRPTLGAQALGIALSCTYALNAGAAVLYALSARRLGVGAAGTVIARRD